MLEGTHNLGPREHPAATTSLTKTKSVRPDKFETLGTSLLYLAHIFDMMVGPSFQGWCYLMSMVCGSLSRLSCSSLCDRTRSRPPGVYRSHQNAFPARYVVISSQDMFRKVPKLGAFVFGLYT